MARAPGLTQWLPLPYGFFAEALRDPLGFQMRARQQFGDVFFTRIGPAFGHFVFHPDHVQHVLCDNQKNYQRGWEYRTLTGLLGEGIVSSEGAYWRRQRRLAQPAFQRGRLVQYVEHMIEATSRMRDRWRRQPVGETLDMSAEMSRLTLGIAGRTFFGRDISDAADTVGSSFAVISRFIDDRISRIGLSWPLCIPTRQNRRFCEARDTLNGLILNLVRERRQEGVDRGDLLSMLIRARDDENGETMTDDQLRCELLTFLLAGHETTAAALAWTWYLLGSHPQSLGRVIEEVRSLLGDEPPTIETASQLTLTRCVIEEAMRLYPPVCMLPRQAMERDEIGGFEIPARSTVVVSQFVTHRHPEIWERPDEYHPERFLPDEVAKRPRFAYFPFIGGPHQCIGMEFAMLEMRIIVAMVLQHFELSLLPGQNIGMSAALTLRPDRPVHFALRPRQRVASVAVAQTLGQPVP